MDLIAELKNENINLNDYDFFIKSNEFGGFDIRLNKLISVLDKEREEIEKNRNIDSDYSHYVSSEIITTYKKPNGDIIYKSTKLRPRNSFSCNSYDSKEFYLQIGNCNQYNHKVIDMYEQYFFKF